MTNLLSFLKHKEHEHHTESHTFNQQIKDLSTMKGITMAKAVEKLNTFQSFKVEDSLNIIATPVTNIKNEKAFRFEDNSVLLNNDGRLSGLNDRESSLWEMGKYFKNELEFTSSNIIEELVTNHKNNDSAIEMNTMYKQRHSSDGRLKLDL